jgi:hypothetical protein
MMPMTPADSDIGRVVENVQQGLPEEDAPAAQGGFGAEDVDIGAAGEALKQEGALDEAIAEDSAPE